MDKRFVKQYLDENKELTLLLGKAPIVEDWTNVVVPVNKVLSHVGNLGWKLGDGDLVIDVDPKNGGLDSYDKLCKDLNVSFDKTVDTPSGGFHIYLKIDPAYRNMRFKRTMSKEYPGIDFLTKGKQCVIPGSGHPKGRYEWADDFIGFDQPNAPRKVLDLISYQTETKQQILGPDDDDDYDPFEGLIGSSSTWAREKVEELLNKLDPSMPNDEWVKVGMALHDWDTEEGLELWEEWSKDGSNYTEEETQKRWKSFDLGGGVTLGTVSYMAKEADFDESQLLVKTYLDKIEKANEKDLEFTVCPKICSLDINNLQRERLGIAVQAKYKELTNVRLPISTIRSMVRPKQKFGDEHSESRNIPEWCDKWVYVNHHGSFVDKKSLKFHKSESFNIENGVNVPTSDMGTKPSATKYVADNGYIEKVEKPIYIPSCPDLIVKIDGVKYVNTFDINSVPPEAEEYTEKGLDLIKRLEKHFELVCNKKKYADFFIDWFAHQVQFPGRKILWAPVIVSIEGMGKSLFNELLRGTLGDSNVGSVSPSQAISSFNGWAYGVQVNFMEEIRIKGHNRYEAVNALKPLISDRVIQINDKGVKQFQVFNPTNYACFTNYKDALPLDEHDRRWWVIFNSIQHISEVDAIVGEPSESYFSKLFDDMRAHFPEIRKWLLEREISEEFMKTKRAPMTPYKMSMIVSEEIGFEGLHELKELIEKGGQYFNKTCISSSDLFDSFMMESDAGDISTSKRHTLLKKLGYMPHPVPLKIDGKTRRVWTKDEMTKKQIRECLKNDEDVLGDL